MKQQTGNFNSDLTLWQNLNRSSKGMGVSFTISPFGAVFDETGRIAQFNNAEHAEDILVEAGFTMLPGGRFVSTPELERRK